MIRRVRFERFKVFFDTTIVLGPLTLLSGLNSSGKSSCLQALALLRQNGEIDGLSGQGLQLNGGYTDLGTGRDVLNEQAELDADIAFALKSDDGSELALRVRAPPDSNLLPWKDTGPEVPPSLEHVITQPGFQYLRADRIGPAVVHDKSHQVAVVRRSLGSAGQFTGHFLSAFRNASVKVEGARINERRDGWPVTSGLLEQVTAWMSEVSPGVRLEVQEIGLTDFVQLRFGFGRTGSFSGTRDFRGTHVGFGLTYVLPIVVACLGGRPGDTVLIENPEAHLHPRGQMAMGRLLALTASSGVQVLVETHSDHVLNGIRIAVRNQELEADHAKLLFFRNEFPNGGVQIEDLAIDRNGKIEGWPVGFFDQFDIALEKLL